MGKPAHRKPRISKNYMVRAKNNKAYVHHYNKKPYYLEAEYMEKHAATKRAKEIRGKGHLARVVKHAVKTGKGKGVGYELWRHNKPAKRKSKKSRDSDNWHTGHEGSWARSKKSKRAHKAKRK